MNNYKNMEKADLEKQYLFLNKPGLTRSRHIYTLALQSMSTRKLFNNGQLHACVTIQNV